MQNKIYCCYHYPVKKESVLKTLCRLSGKIIGALFLIAAAWLFMAFYWLALVPTMESIL